MHLIEGRSPPTDGIDAFHFPVGGGVIIHGKTRQLLVKNIFEYRVRNNQPIGDIEAEIDGYYCGRWPGFCSKDVSGLGKSKKAVAQEMLNRVSQWASMAAQRMPRGGYALELQSEADRRAAICVQCKSNGGWKTGCGGCDAVTLQLIQAIKKMKSTVRDGNLSACQIGGFELSAAVHLPADATPITDQQRAQMPADCWRKAL